MTGSNFFFFFCRMYHDLFFSFFASLLSVSSLEHEKGKDSVCFTYFSIPRNFQRAWRQDVIQKHMFAEWMGRTGSQASWSRAWVLLPEAIGTSQSFHHVAQTRSPLLQKWETGRLCSQQHFAQWPEGGGSQVCVSRWMVRKGSPPMRWSSSQP